MVSSTEHPRCKHQEWFWKIGVENYSLQNDRVFVYHWKMVFVKANQGSKKKPIKNASCYQMGAWLIIVVEGWTVELYPTIQSFQRKMAQICRRNIVVFFFGFLLYNWFFIDPCRFLQRRLNLILDVDLRLLSVCIELWLEVIIWGFLNEGDATSVDSRQVSVWWLGVGWVKPFWLKLVDLFVPIDTYESWPHPNTW